MLSPVAPETRPGLEALQYGINSLSRLGFKRVREAGETGERVEDHGTSQNGGHEGETGRQIFKECSMPVRVVRRTRCRKVLAVISFGLRAVGSVSQGGQGDLSKSFHEAEGESWGQHICQFPRPVPVHRCLWIRKKY